MTDIDVPMRYATPAADRTERDGSVGLVVVLALALAVAAVGLAMVSREMAEPFVLAILAGLAVVGVFCLFAGAVGILHFGGRHARNDVTKAFVDNLPQGALIADSAGRVLYADESYRDLLGLDTEANVPAPDRAFAGNPHLAECIFRLSRAAQQGRSLKEEFRLPPPGEAEEETGIAPRWFRISVQPMPPDPRSGRKGALTVWQVDEITMDRAREEASFAKVQSAIAYLDSAPAGFFTADAEGTIEYLNATLAQWLGLDLTEVAGRALKLEAIMSADSAALIARSGRGQSQGATRRFDIDLVKADGTSLPVRVLHRLPRPGSSGALAHALVLSRGPGEAEEAGAAELRFARLFHSAPIAIATVDGEGRISATNAAFMRLFGAADEGRKVLLESLVEPESHPALRRALDAALARQSQIGPVDIAFAGDRDRSGRIYLSPIEQTAGEGEAAIAYAIDITEQRALEMQIAQGPEDAGGRPARRRHRARLQQHADGDHRLLRLPADEPPADRPRLPGHHEHQAEREPGRGPGAPIACLLAPADPASAECSRWATCCRSFPFCSAACSARMSSSSSITASRPLAGEGGPASVRAGDHQPRRQCPRRHARGRQARDPHRQCQRERVARARQRNICRPPNMC